MSGMPNWIGFGLYPDELRPPFGRRSLLRLVRYARASAPRLDPAGVRRGGAMSQRPRVTVVGSLNTDISLPVPHLPGPGETVLAQAAATVGTGGKGANQAVAAARLGAATRMVGCCGDDEF